MTKTVKMRAGVLHIVSIQVNRKLLVKAKTHEKLGTLAENILNRINNRSSIAPNDDKVSAKEFSVICQSLATFRKQSYNCEQRPKESAEVKRKVVEPLLQRTPATK